MSQHRPAAQRLKKFKMAGAAGLASLMVLAACGSTEDPAPGGDPGQDQTSGSGEVQEGGTLRVGIIGEPGVLDPTLTSGTNGAKVLRSACRYLYDADAYSEGQTLPILAADMPQMSEDGLVATVELREDVLFQDGTPMDAAAVVRSFERHRDMPGTGRTGDVAQIDALVALDDYTLEFQLNVAYSSVTAAAYLSRGAGYPLSPTALDEMTDDEFSQTPVCVGPFKVVNHVPNVEVRLAKDENFFGADDVHLDELVFVPIADTNVRTTNLRSGEIDVMEQVAATEVGTFEADPDLAVSRIPGSGSFYVGFNTGKPNSAGEEPGVMGQNKLLRQAFELSIDREAISQTVFNGEFPIACGFMHPSSAVVSDKLLECPEYDPERAREMVEESGVDLPIQFDITINQQPEFRRMAEMVQAMAGEVGFEIEIDITEQVTMSSNVRTGDFDAVLRTWGGRPEPDINITRFAHSAFYDELGGFASDLADELIEAARFTESPEERTRIYEELDEHLRDEAFVTYLVRPAHLFGHRSNVTGVDAHPNGHPYLEHAAFLAD